MSSKSIMEQFITLLPTIWDRHAPGSELYTLLKQVVRDDVIKTFSNNETDSFLFSPFGKVVFPYYKMGNTVDTTNLFDIDELMIFSFYWVNRERYKYVLDAGANLGLHSIILSKCGYEVRTYEPDPVHFQILSQNLKDNNCSRVSPYQAAVSYEAGETEFVKVLGNTTSSHLAGAKLNPYGDLERFSVKVESVHPLLEWADLVKMDVEGHEKDIILSTKREQWTKTDALVEIENGQNAAAVFEHLTALDVSMFAQKNNWQKVRDVADMPTSYHDGTLFISCKESMPWS